MGVTQTKNGRYSVRVQFHGKRVRGGFYDTEKEAKLAERRLKRKLQALEKLSIEDAGPYEPQLIETDKNLVARCIERFKKLHLSKAN